MSGGRGSTKQTDPNTRMVTVCSECLQASCWHGEFMCERSRGANVTRRTVGVLRGLDREHPSHYSVRNVRKVCGAEAVAGYEHFEGTDEEREP
jgi:hypothetical protein